MRNSDHARHKERMKNPKASKRKREAAVACTDSASYTSQPLRRRARGCISIHSRPAQRIIIQLLLKLQTLLAEPILLCAMIFFAAAFSLRLNRYGGILNAMMAGMFVPSKADNVGATSVIWTFPYCPGTTDAPARTKGSTSVTGSGPPWPPRSI